MNYSKREMAEIHEQHLERGRKFIRSLGIDPERIDDGFAYGILYDVGTMVGFMSAPRGERHEDAIATLAARLRDRISDCVVGHEFGKGPIYKA